MDLNFALVVDWQTGELHHMALQSEVEFGRAVHRDGEAYTGSRSRVNVVAAVDPMQGPSVGFDQFGLFFARKEFHSASSMT